ncbi:methyltransferase [Yersinia aleksiciae]|uniref:Hydroxyneurosporene-O-methyltransferase n=1 Tax=Yersinia aleksiciae TaxID=263819 RepID=A0A0T9ULR0_YERAE|nr:methyltransferase [Yersinia aleksiciae]AKP33889.1 SAM-dependent methyltransferase [Yersinia aleksiciae]CFQ49907.1 Hydroxyneurosporene-O-methyltransferase [Yersinia aleksiciae]CNL51664.1 Hydroxyneurosporene-O-methyltransferase [Yersinia aleksiciae]
MIRVIKKAQCDDKTLFNIATSLYLYPTAILAHHFGIFEFIAKDNKNASEICAFIGIELRSVEVVMAVVVALELVELEDGRYKLTKVTEEFLLKKSPNYCGHYWDLIYSTGDNFSLANLEQVVRTRETQDEEQVTLFEESIYNTEKAEAFTKAMHGISVGAASVWPDKLNLADYHCMLDIGGGSGVHSVGAVTRWPHLRAIIYDLAPVGRITSGFIKSYGLEENISIHIGDMWSEPYPDADLHFYSNVLHDWPAQKNLFLTKKSYDALPHGGRIIIHEMLFDDDVAGPLAVAALNVTMLIWSQGKQYSRSEMKQILYSAGFRDIEILPAAGYFSIITGVKP